MKPFGVAVTMECAIEGDMGIESAAFHFNYLSYPVVSRIVIVTLLVTYICAFVFCMERTYQGVDGRINFRF